MPLLLGPLGPLSDCTRRVARYCPLAMYEEGLFTLAKIVTCLIGAMSVVPLLFLSAESGDRGEPEEVFDTD